MINTTISFTIPDTEIEDLLETYRAKGITDEEELTDKVAKELYARRRKEIHRKMDLYRYRAAKELLKGVLTNE